jgi:hypothetical protein
LKKRRVVKIGVVFVKSYKRVLVLFLKSYKRVLVPLFKSGVFPKIGFAKGVKRS